MAGISNRGKRTDEKNQARVEKTKEELKTEGDQPLKRDMGTTTDRNSPPESRGRLKETGVGRAVEGGTP